MKKVLKATALLASFAAFGLIAGCGDDNPSQVSGAVVKGPVQGAIIFADKMTSGASNFIKDAGENSAVTDANGKFSMNAPGYTYRFVSYSGLDKISKKRTITMMAPSGAANVTPLTTLVSLDTTGTVKAKLEALLPTGKKFDADISDGANATTAVLLVAKSVETAVQSITDAVKTSAGAGKISATQIAAVQSATVKAIADTVASNTVTATTLATPAALGAQLDTAVAAAATTIKAANTNITALTIPAGTMTTAASSIGTALGATNVNAAVATTAIGSTGEASVLTTTALSAITTAATTATGSVTATATQTPTTYTPPVITGATGGTSTGTGTNQ